MDVIDIEEEQHDSEIEITSPQTSISLKEKGSKVWLHYTKSINYKENKKATCNYCGKILKCTGSSTSTLRTHLKNKHPLQISESNIQQLIILKMFSTSKVSKKFFILFCFINF